MSKISGGAEAAGKHTKRLAGSRGKSWRLLLIMGRLSCRPSGRLSGRHPRDSPKRWRWRWREPHRGAQGVAWLGNWPRVRGDTGSEGSKRPELGPSPMAKVLDGHLAIGMPWTNVDERKIVALLHRRLLSSPWPDHISSAGPNAQPLGSGLERHGRSGKSRWRSEGTGSTVGGWQRSRAVDFGARPALSRVRGGRSWPRPPRDRSAAVVERRAGVGRKRTFLSPALFDRIATPWTVRRVCSRCRVRARLCCFVDVIFQQASRIGAWPSS